MLAALRSWTGVRAGVYLARNSSQDRPARSLPLITLYLTERCNSRCVSCEYWRHGRADMTPESVTALLPALERLGTKVVLISGGEPLIHPQWVEIAETLRTGGRALWLLTSGLSLVKHAARAAALFQSITVSLDGIDRPMYAAIRGLDAFEKVCAGIKRLRPAARTWASESRCSGAITLTCPPSLSSRAGDRKSVV